MAPLDVIHTAAVEQGTVKSLASSSPSQAETASPPRLSLSPSPSVPSPISPLYTSVSAISLPRSIPIPSSPTTSESTSKTNTLKRPKLSSPGKPPPPDLDDSLLPHYASLIEMFSRPRVNVQDYQSVLTPFFVPIKAPKGEDPTYYQEEEEEEFIDDVNDEDYVASGYRSTRNSRGKRPKRATMKNFRSDRYVAQRCLLCGHILSHQSQMNQHIMDHFDIYPFRCYIDGCSFSSTRKADLTKHVREQHEMRELHQCPYCPGALKHERNLRRHIRSKHPYGRIPRSKMVSMSRQGTEEVDSDEPNVLEADSGRDQSVHAIPDDYDSRLVEVDRLLVDSQDVALLVPVLPRHTSRLYAS
ncbi:hypothetical protein FS842_008492 [Serendipita sp. 407]|nr:hypothetical protein FS842_008492 [Serendipita sp. 407]